MEAAVAYTFVCLSDRHVSTFVDIGAVLEGAYRQHALQLLRDHASAATVEIWRDEIVVEVVGRDEMSAVDALAPRA